MGKRQTYFAIILINFFRTLNLIYARDQMLVFAQKINKKLLILDTPFFILMFGIKKLHCEAFVYIFHGH